MYVKLCLFCRMTIAFFSLAGLELLSADDLPVKDKAKIIEYIYGLQIIPDDAGKW